MSACFPAALLLVGCRVPEGGLAEDCDLPRPEPPAEYPRFVLGDASFAWEAAPAEHSINIDVGSFLLHSASMAEEEVVGGLTAALAYWNAAGANVTLEMGDTALDCCTSATDTACDRMCTEADDYMDIRVEDARGAGAAVQSGSENGPCKLTCDVTFYTIGRDDAHIEWVYRAVTDDDSTDGSYQKPFYDTLVHELAHCLGIGDNVDAAYECSVSYHDPATFAGCDGSCCSYTEYVSTIDEDVLRNLYPWR